MEGPITRARARQLIAESTARARACQSSKGTTKRSPARSLTEGPLTRARARKLREIEEFDEQDANAQLDHELRLAVEQSQRQPGNDPKLESVQKDASTPYRPTRKARNVSSWIIHAFGFLIIAAILRSTFDHYSNSHPEEEEGGIHPVNSITCASPENICKSLDQTGSQIFDDGGAMAELLPSSIHLTNISSFFEPQLRLLAPEEIRFHNKTSYLRNLKAYGEGLDKTGRDLKAAMMTLQPGIDEMNSEIVAALVNLEVAIKGTRWPAWITDFTRELIAGVLEAVDLRLELVIDTMNANIQQLKHTDRHRLLYLQQYRKVRQSIQVAIDERESWFKWRQGSKTLHSVLRSVEYLRYPTDDILAVLQCSYHRLTLLQLQLQPIRQSRDLLYNKTYTINSRDEVLAITEGLRQASRILDFVAGNIQAIMDSQEECQEQLSYAIPIPGIWNALNRAGDEARKEQEELQSIQERDD